MTEATITYSDGYTRTLKGVDAKDVVFTTPHGSRLYGLDHEDSDYDGMVVYRNSRKPVHKKVGEEDTIHVGFSHLLLYAVEGSHQYLEGLFSQQKTWYAVEYKPVVDSIVVPSGPVRKKYERTIKKFSFGPEKQRRHAVRLAYNLMRLSRDGRFNPTLERYVALRVKDIGSGLHNEELFEYLVH